MEKTLMPFSTQRWPVTCGTEIAGALSCHFAFLLLLSIVGFPLAMPCRGDDGQPPSARLVQLGMKYCAACHAVPPTDAFTQEHWPKLFDVMRPWIIQRQLPFDESEYAELLALYQQNSPETFALPPGDFDLGPLGFVHADVGKECEEERPKITHVNVTDLDQDGKADVLVCDDVTGQVTWLKIKDDSWQEIRIADIVSPAKTTVLDYNGDGHLDIIVASLGFISPTDELIGSVWLLVNRGDQSFEPLRLVGDIPRVTDVKPGDFNGDGKIDFIVTAFGWRESGAVILLEQATPTLFIQRQVLLQNGAMQVEVTDLDQDGLLDFVVLFSQQHEELNWFRNAGGGRFESRLIARADNPAFGSSGFQLVDLDGDGDLDILYTNGDMMDEVSQAKPYHGLRWLENMGGSFRGHDLLSMPGCYRAVAYDMNGDGHLDIVVSNLYFDWPIEDYPSLIWLENDGSMRFTPHMILYGPTNLVALDVGDLNHDGLPDIIAGGLHLPGPLGRHARLTAVFATGQGPDPSVLQKDKIPTSPVIDGPRNLYETKSSKLAP